MKSPPEVKAKSEPATAAAMPRSRRGILLRRGDQTAVALLLAAALIWCGMQWFRAGGATGHLVNLEVDHAEKLPRPTVSYLVDVNTADIAELGELPQVGPNLARRMIEHRERHGPFRSADDLLRVKGIGPKTLAALRPHVRFD